MVDSKLAQVGTTHLFASSSSVIAVSYTHLDVYKRQYRYSVLSLDSIV